VPRKVILDPEISARLDTVLSTSRQTLSGFVQDALVQRLARWEPATAFIDRKRRKLGHGEQSAFDGAKCHPSGWPLRLPSSFWKLGEPADHIENLCSLMSVSFGDSRDMLTKAWKHAGLGAYGEEEWQATRAWYKDLAKAPQPDAAPETLPEGWGQ
jgi:predicted transcriptional regulator